MQTGYYVKGFHFTEELEAMLQDICKDTKMNQSEVVRQLVKKCFTDKKTREIITRNSYWEKAQKKMQGDTSHNVHCVNDEKKDSPHHSDESTLMSVSEDHQLDCNQFHNLVNEGVEAVIKAPKQPNLWVFFWRRVQEYKESEDILRAIYAKLKAQKQDPYLRWEEQLQKTIEIVRKRWLTNA